MDTEIVKITSVHDENFSDIIQMIHDFRHELAALKNKLLRFNLEKAKDEAIDYLQNPYELYAIKTLGDYTGFCASCVLRVFDKTVWLEQLFTKPDFRRNKFARKLLKIANNKARSLGKNTAFVNVHPNNVKMINFLKSESYSVLNLLEIRKAYTNETLTTKIKVEDIEFDY